MREDNVYERRIKQLVAGRTLDQQIECVEREGNHGKSSLLRNSLLAGLGIPPPKKTADNLIVFGCYVPFNMPMVIRDHIKLLERLGVDYTYLEKETCCGVPMLRAAAEEERDKARTASKGFMEVNRDTARQKGAKSIAYCCIGCAHMAGDFFPDDSVRHMYFHDLIADRLEGKTLKIAPTVVGYYEGCHAIYRDLIPGVSLNWSRYRSLLEQIEGLELAPMPDRVCCQEFPDHVVEVAEKRDLKTILCSCNGCYGRINAAAKGRVRVRYITEVLLEALGPAKVP